MTPLLIYFLKANLALGLFYVGYRLLFQEDTFFRLRRVALLSIYLIAFLYQLPDISGWLAARESVAEVVAYYSSVITVASLAPMEEATTATDWKETLSLLLQLIYAAGVVILTLRCIIELMAVVYTYLQSKKAEINGTKVCLLQNKEEAYSFFKWIFMPHKPIDNQTLQEILLHETTHVRGLHSLDVILGEMIAILCWMNPFAWLLKKEISINHEYLADQQVIYAGYDKKEYQYHLIGMERPNMAAAKLYNNFSVLPLKKRITMLNRKRTNSVRKVKYLALIPMAVCLLLINNIDAMARLVSEPATVAPDRVAAVIIPATTVPTELTASPLLQQDKDKVYDMEDKSIKKPEYKGTEGDLFRYIAKSVKYPVAAQEKGIQGRVHISFIVEKDGSLTNFVITEKVDEALDAEALRVVKNMKKWTPGEKDGKKIRVKYNAPITFRLQ